jgi:hypothetical protein
MLKTRQQNDSQHLLNPLNHYIQRTHRRLLSKTDKQLRKKTSGAYLSEIREEAKIAGFLQRMLSLFQNNQI